MIRLAAFAAAVVLCLGLPARAEVATQEITYMVGDQEFTGHLAYEATIKGPRPGVLVVHEWWGLNEYARYRAEKLAEMGYTALAVDMYGTGKVARHPDDAKAFMQAVLSDIDGAERRFETARYLLAANQNVDPKRIAALGYCFGGGIVLHMARIGAELSGIVSYHGTLAAKEPAAPGVVRTPILVFTGEDDPFIPPAQVKAFETEMLNADAPFRIVSYPGVTHSFTNPAADEIGKRFELPVAYDAGADKDSWARTEAFLKEVFGQK